MDCILQARILEWVAVPFSRGSSQSRDRTHVSHIAGGFFTSWATREVLNKEKHSKKRYALFTFSESNCVDYQLSDTSEGAILRGWGWIQISPMHEIGTSCFDLSNLSFISKMGRQMTPFREGLRCKCKMADIERDSGPWGYLSPLSPCLQSLEDTHILAPHEAGIQITWNLLIFFTEINNCTYLSSFFFFFSSWAAFQIWVSCEAWKAAYLAESVE